MFVTHGICQWLTYDASLSRDRIPSPPSIPLSFFRVVERLDSARLGVWKNDAGRPTGYMPCFYFPCNFKSPPAPINSGSYPEIAARMGSSFWGSGVESEYGILIWTAPLSRRQYCTVQYIECQSKIMSPEGSRKFGCRWPHMHKSVSLTAVGQLSSQVFVQAIPEFQGNRLSLDCLWPVVRPHIFRVQV